MVKRKSVSLLFCHTTYSYQPLKVNYKIFPTLNLSHHYFKSSLIFHNCIFVRHSELECITKSFYTNQESKTTESTRLYS